MAVTTKTPKFEMKIFLDFRETNRVSHAQTALRLDIGSDILDHSWFISASGLFSRPLKFWLCCLLQ